MKNTIDIDEIRAKMSYKKWAELPAEERMIDIETSKIGMIAEFGERITTTMERIVEILNDRM